MMMKTTVNDLWDMRVSNGKHFEERQAERVSWFKKIEPKSGNWKDPIDAVIDAADFTDCNEAARWFTGGELTIADGLNGSGKIRVESAGYYVNIGA
jgi:hypothetical protein